MVKAITVWKYLLAVPAFSGLLFAGSLLGEQRAIAGSAPASSSSVTSVADIHRLTSLDAPVSDADTSVSAMDQLNSVSQLSDVQPTDWAFQALQSLVERYGCVVGYPDSTYRGNRAMTRYEFAAGLNACMDRVNELIATATADLVTKEDLATLQRLQEEFAAELATLRGRVDALEARTAKLEAQQFSTTTKLSGLVWMNLTSAGTGGPILKEGTGFAPGPVNTVNGAPSTTFSTLAWLTLTTSFSGKDSLVTQLAFGNGISPANTLASAGLFNTFGVPFTDQTAFTNDFVGGQFTASTQVVIHDLFYSFPIGDTVQVTAGPRVNWYRHFDDNRYTFFLFGTSSFNSIGSTLLNGIDRGSGAVISWRPSRQFQFNVGYLGAEVEFLPFQPFNSASNPAPGQGLFGGLNTLTAELTYSPIPQANIRLLYNRTNQTANAFGTIGTEPIYGLARDVVGGGPLGNATSDTFSVNFDLEITKWLGLFGRYGYATTDFYRPDGLGRSGSLAAQSYQIGLAFPDLGKKGAQGTFSFLVPYTVTSGRENLVSGGGNGGKQYEFEFAYYYPVSDGIALVPAFYIIGEPNNFSNNPPIYVGNLRTQFSF